MKIKLIEEYLKNVPEALEAHTAEELEELLSVTHPLSLFNEKVVNPVTGEQVCEKRNWFSPLWQVGEPTYKNDVGPEILKEVAKPSDLKARVRALTGLEIQQLYGNEELSASEHLNIDQDMEDKESDDFNLMMSQSPYACNEEGVSNYEIALAQGEEEKINALNDYLANSSADPLMKAISNLPLDKQKELMEEVSKVINGGIGSSPQGDDATPPSDNNGE